MAQWTNDHTYRIFMDQDGSIELEREQVVQHLWSESIQNWWMDGQKTDGCKDGQKKEGPT